MKNVLFIICIIGLGCSHYWLYNRGFDAGTAKAIISSQKEIAKQESDIVAASEKILDLQKIIANNTDECFGRVWPAEITSAANPQLR